MRFPVDADLFVFLYTASKIAFGSLPRLRRSSPDVPARYQITNVPANFLTEAQARYLAPYDEKLAAMNYWPVCTYRINNYGTLLAAPIRESLPKLPAASSRSIELALKVDGRPAASNTCTMSFHTRFTDDRILTTRNMKLKNILDNPPYWMVQECPHISEPSEMKRIHDARAQTMGCPVAPFIRPRPHLQRCSKRTRALQRLSTFHWRLPALSRWKQLRPRRQGPLARHPQLS